MIFIEGGGGGDKRVRTRTSRARRPKSLTACVQGGGAFHQAFCQCFSLTNLLSANQMQGFQ